MACFRVDVSAAGFKPIADEENLILLLRRLQGKPCRQDYILWHLHHLWLGCCWKAASAIIDDRTGFLLSSGFQLFPFLFATERTHPYYQLTVCRRENHQSTEPDIKNISSAFCNTSEYLHSLSIVSISTSLT